MLISDPDSTNLSVAVEMTIMNKVFIFANFSNIQELYVCYKNSKSSVYCTCLNMDSLKGVNECIKFNTDLLKLLFGLVFDGFFFFKVKFLPCGILMVFGPCLSSHSEFFVKNTCI